MSRTPKWNAGIVEEMYIYICTGEDLQNYILMIKILEISEGIGLVFSPLVFVSLDNSTDSSGLVIATYLGCKLAENTEVLLI